MTRNVSSAYATLFKIVICLRHCNVNIPCVKSSYIKMLFFDFESLLNVSIWRYLFFRFRFLSFFDAPGL